MTERFWHPPAWWVFASRNLPIVKRTPELLIRAQRRNPIPRNKKARRAGHGDHGVNDLEKRIAVCEEAFNLVKKHFALKRPERLWQETWDEPPSRAMKLGLKLPVRLHLFDLRSDEIDEVLNDDPITEEVLVRVHTRPADVSVEPVVALPGLIRRGSEFEVHRWFMACIVHELVHVFNAWHLPSLGISGHFKERLAWKWFDEALATATEAELLGNDHDWLLFMLDWLIHPEHSLDSPRSFYQAGMFVRYLDRNVRHPAVPSVAHEVWRRARIGATGRPGTLPFSVLNEVLGEASHVFASSDPAVTDVFASGYCMDSYFLWDAASGAHEPTIHALHGARAVTCSWRIGLHKNVRPVSEADFELPYLACRYFRFYPSNDPMNLKVEVTVPEGSLLKAELAIVAKNSSHRLGTLGSQPVTKNRRTKLVLKTLTGFCNSLHEHAVLVVTNCAIPGVNTEPDQPPVKFDVFAKAV